MQRAIGIVSQKGGVGKSTLCRLIACEYARAGWRVKIADMDASQGTSFNWQRRRIEQELEPQVRVEMFRRVSDALQIREPIDLLLFDGAPHATQATLQIAQASQLCILPTGTALDDLEPTIQLAHELRRKDIPRERLAICLSRVGNSEAENQEAIEYIDSSGYHLFTTMLPEKTAYRRASDMGRVATETTHASTNHRAAELVREVVTHMQNVTTLEVA